MRLRIPHTATITRNARRLCRWEASLTRNLVVGGSPRGTTYHEIPRQTCLPPTQPSRVSGDCCSVGDSEPHTCEFLYLGERTSRRGVCCRARPCHVENSSRNGGTASPVWWSSDVSCP